MKKRPERLTVMLDKSGYPLVVNTDRDLVRALVEGCEMEAEAVDYVHGELYDKAQAIIRKFRHGTFTFEEIDAYLREHP